jgi:hypothetical protein
LQPDQQELVRAEAWKRNREYFVGAERRLLSDPVREWAEAWKPDFEDRVRAEREHREAEPPLRETRKSDLENFMRELDLEQTILIQGQKIHC